jgi:hypothetical protein
MDTEKTPEVGFGRAVPFFFWKSDAKIRFAVRDLPDQGKFKLYSILTPQVANEIGYASYEPVYNPNAKTKLIGMRVGYISIDNLKFRKQGLSPLLGYAILKKLERTFEARAGTAQFLAGHPDPNLRDYWVAAGVEYDEAQQEEWDRFKKEYNIDDNGNIVRYMDSDGNVRYTNDDGQVGAVKIEDKMVLTVNDKYKAMLEPNLGPFARSVKPQLLIYRYKESSNKVI